MSKQSTQTKIVKDDGIKALKLIQKIVARIKADLPDNVKINGTAPITAYVSNYYKIAKEENKTSASEIEEYIWGRYGIDKMEQELQHIFDNITKQIEANKEIKKAAKLAKDKGNVNNIKKDDIGKSNDDDYLIRNNVTTASTNLAISLSNSIIGDMI